MKPILILYVIVLLFTRSFSLYGPDFWAELIFKMSKGNGDVQALLKNRMEGMRVRDEFLCPVTCELFREPVVASDGHSYERLAIEKWLKSKTTSPRTGKTMDKFLTPNLNLQKLIHDMIEEGGASLYTKDSSDVNRLFYVYAQKSLVMQCLGPPESKWNQQVFEVTQSGCIGGRRVPTAPPCGDGESRTDSVLFDDSTVSRIHFEVAHDTVGRHYTIRDLGSAGGTFIRIPFGKKKQLHIGSMILLGKHQFKVASIEPVNVYGTDTRKSLSNIYRSDSKSGDERTHCEQPQTSSLEAIVGDAEALLLALEELSVSGNDDEDEVLDKQSQAARIQAHMQRLRVAASALSSPLGNPSSNSQYKYVEEKQQQGEKGTSISCVEKSQGIIPDESDEVNDSVDMRMSLICFAPEGSPLIGISYLVGKDGATLGRAKSNDISLMLEDRSIDNSVSQEHARIEMDKASGSFFLCDGGNSGKASTNGTWHRLSSPHQKSSPHELKPGMEILIGTVRFQASERMTIKEEMIE